MPEYSPRDLHVPLERDDEYTRVAGVVSFIRENYASTLRVADLAQRGGLSVYQFDQRIRRIFGITPGQLIQKVRIDAAIEKLEDAQIPIARIALDCGYADQSAFSRQFKQMIGLGPAEYRRTRVAAGGRQ